MSRVGEAIGAGFAAASVSVVGVLFATLALALARATGRDMKSMNATLSAIALGFSSGALLSGTFLLVLPESLELLKVAYPGDERAAISLMGSLVMLAILCGAILSWMSEQIDVCRHRYIDHEDESRRPAACKALHVTGSRVQEVALGLPLPEHTHDHALMQGGGHTHSASASAPEDHEHGGIIAVGEHDHEHNEGAGCVDVEPIRSASVSDEQSPDVGAAARTRAGTAATAAKATTRARMSVVVPVLLGDFVHNAVDGALIGVASQACGSATLWVVAAGAIVHEIAQELADYMLLVTRGQLSVWRALGLNAISALAGPLFAGIGATVPLDNGTLGAMLALSAGAYTYLGISISLAPLLELTAPRLQALALTSFILGATAIGLALLNHTHCEAKHTHAHVDASLLDLDLGELLLLKHVIADQAGEHAAHGEQPAAVVRVESAVSTAWMCLQAAPAVTGLTLRQILAGYKAELLHAEQVQQEEEQSHGHDHDHDHH